MPTVFVPPLVSASFTEAMAVGEGGCGGCGGCVTIAIGSIDVREGTLEERLDSDVTSCASSKGDTSLSRCWCFPLGCSLVSAKVGFTFWVGRFRGYFSFYVFLLGLLCFLFIRRRSNGFLQTSSLTFYK